MSMLGLYATEYIFYAPLTTTGAQDYQSNPTIAAGDFQVSTDGSAWTNLDTLPSLSPAGDVQVKITVSVAEMTGKKVTIRAIDAAGDEWEDDFWEIDTYGNASAQHPNMGVDIDAVLTAAHGSGSWQQAGTGSGAHAITITVRDATLTPVPNIFVSIYDAANAVELNNGTTNLSGQVVFNLNANSYNIRSAGIGWTPDTSPDPLVVSGDASVNHDGTVYAPAGAGAPLCTVWGYIYDAGGNARNDVEAIFTGAIPIQVGNNIVTQHQARVVPGPATDAGWAAGYFEIDLLRNSTVKYTDPMTGRDDHEFTVPDAGSVALATLL